MRARRGRFGIELARVCQLSGRAKTRAISPTASSEMLFAVPSCWPRSKRTRRLSAGGRRVGLDQRVRVKRLHLVKDLRNLLHVALLDRANRLVKILLLNHLRRPRLEESAMGGLIEELERLRRLAHRTGRRS